MINIYITSDLQVLNANPTQVQRLFRFVWAEGNAGDDADALQQLLDEFGLSETDVTDEAVKSKLRENTEAAVKAEIFGVPSFVIDGEVFWGFDAIDFVNDYLADSNLLQTPAMQAIDHMPDGLQRKP